VGTLDAVARQKDGEITKTKRAELVGSLLAQKALDKGIKRVVFDRGGHKYHGRVKALADAARLAGLDF
jgi:large subunit ribosomal protein L18